LPQGFFWVQTRHDARADLLPLRSMDDHLDSLGNIELA
jgi:hypothetical protein